MINKLDSLLAVWRREGERATPLSDKRDVTESAGNSVIATVVGVAGAGFRLSLLLNAVGVEMMPVNREIQAIAKEISLSSLMLKQVGLAVTSPGISASYRALETAKEIAMQNQMIFTEIKDMAEMSQQRDENGHIRSITIASKAQSWFRKQRVQYLLGQLISLKLSLSIMLQVLQLGKTIAVSRFVLSPPSPKMKIPKLRHSTAEMVRNRRSHSRRCCKNGRKFIIWWWCEIGRW